MENLENVDLGPPDSHEAMNNREINPKGIREKRSFEFLMGLINRNSSYEVVKKEEATEKPKKSHTSRGTEILLDLLMKIATNQEQWNNVHQMLQNLDEDLVVSRHLVKKFKEQNDTHLTEFTSPVNLIKEANLSENATPTEKSWPIFTEQPLFQNSAENENGLAAKSTENSKSYQKNFAYRRVTVSGKPAYLKKNPTAYIAVSVISPKTITSKYQDNEDILENELHRLKPWPPKKST